MSDLWERAVNFYHLRLIPTVKRMLERRRIAYTLLTVGVLLLSVTALSLLVCHTAEALKAYDGLAADYEDYLMDYLSSGNKKSPMPEMGQVIALARSGEVAVSLLCGGLWLMLSVVAVGWVMAAVMESEAYVYGLFMIYGADRKQLSRQLSVEFLLSGIPALALGLPLGFGLYRLIGGTEGFPSDVLWLSVPCFLLLILLCASVLARRILGRSCMRMLNASDTSDSTVSPRRSHPGGLYNRRGTLASAGLAFLRMRRHYISLALVAALVSATVFGSLSHGGLVPAADQAPYQLYFANGTTAEGLELNYLQALQDYPAVQSFSYAVTNSAEGLGTHLRLTEAQNPDQSGVYLGTQYATDSIRIACGDGDSSFELGGGVTIPEEYSHLPPEAMTEFGYELDAVPVGGVVYVFPKNQGSSLALQVGDSVTLSLPSPIGGSLADRVEEEGETVTLRVVDVVEVGNIMIKGTGQEVCPRITEDYLYLNPLDYEKFDGQNHAESFVAEEVYPDELFGEDTEGTCILAVPDGYFESIRIPDTVTVISPTETVRTPFSGGNKQTLSDETYFMNQTYRGTGVYLGSASDYMADPNAAGIFNDLAKKNLTKYVGPFGTDMTRREYRVVSIIPTGRDGNPYLILPRSEEINFSLLYNDLCALQLMRVSADAPALTMVQSEAYLLSTSISFANLGVGRNLYIGTALMPDFITGMEEAGIRLQAPAPTFAHSRTVIGGSFTLGNTHYLLAEPFVYPKPIQADRYPRYVTGAGSFLSVGDTSLISIITASEAGFYARFHENDIGSLRKSSIPMAGYYAVNDWIVAPAVEAADGLTLPQGSAVVAVPSPEKSSIRVGDTLSVAIRQDTSSLLSDPELMGLAGNRLLSYLTERVTYEYVTVTVTDVIKGESETLILSENDLRAVLGQEGIYRDLDIFLHPSVSMTSYLNFHIAIQSLVKRSSGEATLLYDKDFITRTAGGIAPTVLLGGMGGISLCLIPLLLLASELLFFGRREEEYAILRAIGKTPSERRRLFAAETGIFCGATTLACALACPVGYGALLMLTDSLGLPLPEAGFDLILYAGVLAAVALSCLAVGFAACLRLEKSSFEAAPRKKKQTMHTNTEKENAT